MNWKKITPVILSGFVCFTPIVSKAETYTYTYSADTPWETILKNIQEELGSGYTVYSNDGKQEYISSDSTENSQNKISTKGASDDTDPLSNVQDPSNTSSEENNPATSSEIQSTESSQASTETPTTGGEPISPPSTEEPTPVTPADPYQDYVEPNGTLSFSQSIDTYTTESSNQVYTYDYTDDGTYDNTSITFNGTGDMTPNILQLGTWMDDGTVVPLKITYEDASGNIQSFESSSDSVIDLSNYGSFKRLIIKAETKGTYHIQGLSLGGTINSKTYTMKADFTGNGKKVYYQSSKLTSKKLYYNLSNPTLKVSDTEVDNEDNLHLYLSSINGEGSASVKNYRMSLTIPKGLDLVNVSPLYFDYADAEISQVNNENGETIININIMPFSDEFKQTSQLELVLQNNSKNNQTISLNAIGLAEFINSPSKQTSSNYVSVLLNGYQKEDAENPEETHSSTSKEDAEDTKDPEPVITNDAPETNEPEEEIDPADNEEKISDSNEPENASDKKSTVTEEKESSSPSQERKEVINPINAVPIPTDPIDDEKEFKDELEKEKERERKEEEEKKNSGTSATGNIDSSSSDLTSSVMDNTDTLISSVGSNIDTSPVEDVETTTEKEENIPTEIKKEKPEDIKDKTTEIVKENRGVQVFLIGAACAVAGIVAIALVLKKMSEEEE